MRRRARQAMSVLQPAPASGRSGLALPTITSVLRLPWRLIWPRVRVPSSTLPPITSVEALDQHPRQHRRPLTQHHHPLVGHEAGRLDAHQLGQGVVAVGAHSISPARASLSLPNSRSPSGSLGQDMPCDVQRLPRPLADDLLDPGHIPFAVGHSRVYPLGLKAGEGIPRREGIARPQPASPSCPHICTLPISSARWACIMTRSGRTAGNSTSWWPSKGHAITCSRLRPEYAWGLVCPLHKVGA